MKVVQWICIWYCIFYGNFNFSDVSSNKVSLRIEQDWNQDYADSASSEYIKLKQQIKTQVSKYLALFVQKILSYDHPFTL